METAPRATFGKFRDQRRETRQRRPGLQVDPGRTATGGTQRLALSSYRMKRKHAAPPKLQPWPGSIFALKTRWEDWITDRHLWVFLERRVPGKFGRLEAMRAIVPKGHNKRELATLFGSPRYRRGVLDSARELFRRAGVPDDQAADFMQTITREFPYPTPNEVFEEEISNPLLKMALGDRFEELSYHRTGVPELTEDDRALIGQCMAALETRVREDPAEGRRFLKFVFGSGLL
jgi:hypothetical protein